MWYTYILLCDGKTYYVGITDNIEKRLLEHKNKQSFFTSKFSNLTLVHSEEFKNKSEAAKREKQLKGWRKEKKEKLIKGEL